MGETGSRIGWNTLVTFLSRVSTRVMKLAGSIVFANIAGAAALGTLYVFMSLYRVGRRLTTLGMGPTIVTRVAEARAQDDPDETGRIVATSLAIRCLPLTVLAIGGYIFADAVGAYVGIGNTWLYLVTTIGATIIYSTGRAVLSGVKRVDLSSSLDVIRDIGITAAQIALILLGFEAFGLVVGFVVGILIAAVVSLLLVLPHLDASTPSITKGKSMVQFAKFAFLDTLVGGEQIWLDVLLLGLFTGTAVTQADIGIYGVAFSISMFGFALSASIGRAILPEISGFETSVSNRVRNKTVKESLRYATVLSVPLALGALTLGDYILRDVFGFGSGRVPLLLLTVGAVGFSAYQPLHQVFYGLDRPHWAFGVSLSTGLVNGVLNLLLIPRSGTTGVAISTALAMWLAFILGYVLLRRVGIENVIPTRSWLIQLGAAILMTVVVFGVDDVLGVRSRTVTVTLVCVGVVTYGAVLLVGEPPIRNRLNQVLP
jgi:O-antigen/teichoic acid export membrane protein